MAEQFTVASLNELIEISQSISRQTIEEYMMLVSNVLDKAFRRDIYKKLGECQSLCFAEDENEIEQRIYSVLDDTMMDYSSSNELPEFKDVVDGYWEEIQQRQNAGYAGIPFKFPALNEYALIEKSELFIFAAEAKQGKSMMLLNCAVDLLAKGYSVLYLDSELNSRMFTCRLIAHLAGVEFNRVRAGKYTAEEKNRIEQSLKWIKTRRFTHRYMPIFDAQSVFSAAKKIKHSQGLDVIIIDYFKSKGDGDAFASYQELGRFVDIVKNEICGSLNVAGIGAAQATSTGKVADSAKIGRNASTIAVIQDKTPEEINTDGIECGNKKLRVVLNRNGMQMAPGEYIDLRFNGNLILYEQAKQHDPNAPY